jgi:hypothetical protein
MNNHKPWCPMKAFGHTDAAKRVHDTYNLHRLAIGNDAIGKWFASALDDGRSDNVLYDSKLDCILHQHHNERYYTFIKIVPPSMNICEAEVMLKTARQLYDNGMRMADPDHPKGGREVIKRVSIEDQLAQSKGHSINLRMPDEIDAMDMTRIRRWRQN